MMQNERTERVLMWREYLSKMPTEDFLDKVRVCLGEIKTPFNKQKLMDSFSDFLCRPENKKNMLALLGKKDLRILSLIHLVPGTTKKRIRDFFKGQATRRQLNEHIFNLEERNLIFSRTFPEDSDAVLLLNPVFESDISPLLSMDLLVSPESLPVEKKMEVSSDSFEVSQYFFAAFISFILTHPDLCKADGKLRKKIVRDFEIVCGTEETENACTETQIQILTDALRNLQILHEKDGGFFVDWQRLNQFAQMPETHRLIFLCAASSGNILSRRSLQSNAQLLMDTLFSMGEGAYTEETLLRLSSLINLRSKNLSSAGPTRFELLMRDAELDGENETSLGMMGAMISSCMSLGILKKIGTGKDGENLFQLADFFKKTNLSQEGEKKVLSIDAGFSVTVMPGLSLSELLEIVRCMDIRHIDVALVFEISRHSVIRAFDMGMKSGDVISILEKYSLYDLPQSLVVSVEDWFNSYDSATLFKGYVLRLSEQNQVMVEKNSVLAPHIVEKLSQGIYLMDFVSDEDARSAIEASGLEYIGKVKSLEKNTMPLGFPILRKNMYTLSRYAEKKSSVETSDDTPEKLISHMKSCLKKMNLPSEKEEFLSQRIERRLIVNESQLQESSIRFDRVEAFAMDYAGKLYVIECAMQNGSLLEIDLNGERCAIVGEPVRLEKNHGEAVLTICPDDNGVTVDISVAAASRVKRVREKINY